MDTTITNRPERLAQEIAAMAALHPPIEIAIPGVEKQLLYYKGLQCRPNCKMMDGIIRSFISKR
ncbi:MAG: hypothetical protein IPJ10_10005 [Flavobacteriales bacterium]|nr:hypothetical protein [Flavobacteriales bacterium]